MRSNLVQVKPVTSSFLSCEKDAETIIKKLFVQSEPYSDLLKKLLIINTKNCLDENRQDYQEIIDNITVEDMRQRGYIKLEPKIRLPEHEEIKSYIIMSFDNFRPNDQNPQFRDCTLSFDVICHTDYWDIKNYRLRPFKIVGYIDGLLNESRLSGIGTIHFAGCNQLVLSEDLSGYTLMYNIIHGSDDQIPGKDE